MAAYKNIAGVRFGRLTAVSHAGTDMQRNALWLCLCDCGNQITVRGSSLRSGVTLSCGCYKLDSLKTHGMSKSRLYALWHGMKVRCLNENGEIFDRYGGRGITICPEWENSFEAFRDWAMANGYRDDLTIDRIDTNGPYSPGNCRWATMKEQENNKRNNHLITFEGETHTVTEWAEIKGINRQALYSRLKRGWSIERALFSPSR